MTFAASALLAVIGLLIASVIALVVLLIRRAAPAPAAPDPTIALLQQQVARVGEQLAQLGAQIPKDVGTSLHQVMGQVGARLAENAKALQQASADTGRLIADVSQKLGEIGKSSQQILDLGQDLRGLQQIFQAPKVRGGLGELSLESLLRQNFPADHFALQYPFRSGDTVDAAVRLPGGLVPIDSKFPLAGFRALLEAAGDEARRKARKAFARDVRRHIDDIAAKYIRPSEGTLDFALMYIPAENVFYEVIVLEEEVAEGDDLNTYAMKQRVMPVSPNSLGAYLKALAYGLMGLAIERRARDILKGLQQLHGDFGIFQESFALGQKHLKNAQGAFQEASDRAGRLSDRMGQFASLALEAPAAEALPPARNAPR